jgi:NTE family protein
MIEPLSIPDIAIDDIAVGDIVIDDDQDLGYRRSGPLQERFLAASETLVRSDGWPNPSNNDERELMADLALEGGGVKGIGLVGAVLVLSEAGYSFRGVAGTSAGAIAAALVAALSKQPKGSMAKLREYLGSLDFARFMPEGKIHEFLDHHGGEAGTLVADAAILATRMGLYPGGYLHEWLSPILQSDLGVTTFGDLELTEADDPEINSLPPGHNYRLLVHTSDITRGQLVHLPWDYPLYGFDKPGGQDVIHAVRASMSIPFFFEPVTFTAKAADVTVPTPGGGTIEQHYDSGTVTWVDGGMLRNFPINAFDRVDGEPARWPTIGVKLSSLQTQFPGTRACESTLAEGVRCLRTMMNEWDSYAVDEATAARTIFVDNGGLTATDFDLTQDQQDMLFLNGVRSATQFVIEMAKVEGVPRTAMQAESLMRARRGTSSPGAT